MTKESTSTTADPIRILVIAGPTAAGKTAFAIETARRYGGEIVSCDSMQLYRFMDIGSAKPTPEERALVPHHLVDCVDPSEGSFSAAKYARLAGKAIEDIHGRGKLPLVCGGTGLYLNALLYDMDFGEKPEDPELRERFSAIAREKGSAELHRILSLQDPDAAGRIHPNNEKKLIRALERLAAGEGQLRPFADIQKENPRYDPVLVGLNRDRKELYDRIDRRVPAMIEAGLVDEVRRLCRMGLSESDIAMLGIGYKEILPLLRGEGDLETAIETIQKNTRHLAKRQLTWFRRYDKMFWLNISEYEDENAALEALFTWLDKRL